MNNKNNEKSSRLWLRILLISGISLVVFIVSIGGYLVYKAKSTWNEVYEERERDEDPIADLRDGSETKDDQKRDNNQQIDDDEEAIESSAEPKERKAFTIALLGVDTRDNNSFKGRSDTIIVAIVEPSTKKVTLLSIPRDSYVYIPEIDGNDKIAHAHAYGRADAAIATLEHFLEVPIDYYISINFHAFKSFIDEIGGITINVEKDLYDLQKGIQHLNGDQALSYVRFRYDREGDFGRNRRQQQMVKAIINQTLEIRNPMKISAMLDILGKNIRTDINLENMLYLAKQFNDLNADNIDSILLTGKPFYYNQRSYVEISDKDLFELREKLAKLIYKSN